jgi:hypothetical protein
LILVLILGWILRRIMEWILLWILGWIMLWILVWILGWILVDLGWIFVFCAQAWCLSNLGFDIMHRHGV